MWKSASNVSSSAVSLISLRSAAVVSHHNVSGDLDTTVLGWTSTKHLYPEKNATFCRLRGRNVFIPEGTFAFETIWRACNERE